MTSTEYGVLVAVGANGIHDGALTFAAAEARRRGTGVELLHVVHSPVTVVSTAEQMQRLGQVQLAEAVRSRLRKQASARPDLLAQLLRQYAAQDRTDVAAEIAVQILRQPPPAAPRLPTSPTRIEPRQEAGQLLTKLGRLQGLIEETTAQLKESSRSVPLHTLLAECCLAAGQRDRACALYVEAARLRPDDLGLRLQAARLLTVGNAWLTWRITFPLAPTTSNGAWIRVVVPGPLSSRASSSLTRCSRSS